MSDSWTDVEDALQSAVASGCALDPSLVVWDYYTKAPRPCPPFAELSLSEIEMQGEDWVTYDDAPDPAPGAELRSMTRGVRSVELTIQVFAPEDGPAGGGSRAWPTLARFLSALASLYPQLDDAGIGVADISPIQSISGRKGGSLEPRARMKMILYVGSELEGRETFIERVQLHVVAGPADFTTTIP